MKAVKVTGRVDENCRLSAQVPEEIRPGPVTVLIVSQEQEDEAPDAWASAVADEWADELNDPGQDIYTMADGEPVR